MIANGQHERDTQKKSIPRKKKTLGTLESPLCKAVMEQYTEANISAMLCSVLNKREKSLTECNSRQDLNQYFHCMVQASEPQSAQNEDSVLCSNLGFFGWGVRRGEKSEWNKYRGWNTLETAPRLPLSECASVRREWRDPQPSVEKPLIPTPLIIGGGTTLHSSFHAATQTESRLIKPYLKFYLF